MHKFSHLNADRLERPERYSLLPPKETLERFGLRPGMSVADIGAGTGYFTRAASEIVGNTGAVAAVDMSEEMLEFIRTKGLAENVRTLLSDEYSIPLDDAFSDLTILAFVVHETPDISRFITEALRITKKKGSILILEWKKQVEEHGPEIDERLDINDLLPHLKNLTITHGDVNPSHYYVLIKK